MKFMLLGEIETNERNLVKAALQNLGEKVEIVSIGPDEFLDNQTLIFGAKPVVMIPINCDQFILPETVVLEPIPITYGPIKKRGKGKIKKW